jgi:UDP-N-acetylmuramoyl-tripeptide--D-alanyl-D-alanine ligase
MSGIPDPGARLTGLVVCDSREAAPGGMFAAISGNRVDGHEFAAQAAAAGVVCVLASRPVDAPAVIADDVTVALERLARAVLRRIGELTVIGVTGSSGKTSTKDLLAQVLERLGPTVATPRSFNTEIGLPLTVLRAGESTRYLVLEMGARHKGDIAHLVSVAPPSVGAVINVGSAHVGVFGSRAAIAAAKGELVEGLPDAAHGGVAVLNADDELTAAMASRTSARVLLYGTRGVRGDGSTRGGNTAHADVRALDVELDDRAQARFTLEAGGESAAVRLAIPGEHQVSNALAVATVAWSLGMDIAAIALALSDARPRSGGRLEVTERPDGITVINDAFNANPESMRAGLKTLAVLAKGRRAVAVLGEMRELGEATRDGHEQVGRAVAELGIDVLIAVGGDEAEVMAGAALDWPGPPAAARAGNPRLSVTIVPDGQAALAALEEILQPGDVVLAKASRAVNLEPLAVSLAAESRGGAGEPLPF